MHTVLCFSSIAVLLQTVFTEGQIHFPSDTGSGGGGFSLSKPRPRPQAQSQSQRPVSQAGQSGSNGCNCLPKSECPKILGQLQYPCLLLRGGEGICCIPQKDVVQTEVGFNKDTPPSIIPTNIIDKGIEMGKKKFQTLLEEEQERLRKGQFLKRGDPARGHAFFFSREPSSKAVHDLALTIALASKEIANMLNLSPQDAFSSLPQIKLQNYESGRPRCLLNNVPRCDPNLKYRIIDGSCNNLKKPLLGKSETGFSRIRPQLYKDGLMTPRENSVDGQLLPNVRKISNNILTDIDLPDRTTPFGVLIWAQFMEHDLTYTPVNDMEGKTIMCCENGHLVSPMPESCFPILISPEDGVYNSRDQRCINFVRSSFALNEDCNFGPVEQLNVVTHWLDGSMIYGSTETTKHKVADLSTGFMRTSANGLPPVNSNLECEGYKRGSTCFVGGDFRINDNPGLLTIQTLWIREHNRIAAILKKLNPHWDSNQLYEETRRIVIAQIQHITYSEWLPIIIGPSLMDKFGINVLKNGYRNIYDPSLDPRIKNEFSTAAFRFGHSLGWRRNFRISETSEQSTLNLKNTFISPRILQNNPDNLDGHVNALTLYDAKTLEIRITQELDNHLLGTSNKREFIIDPMSLNLQRGRDHAISTYNTMREAFGIGRARTFNDLRNTTPDELIVRIQKVYRTVDDIDLWIGGMTERPVRNGVVGSTFANIVGSQFQASMNGDRYFYDMGNQAGSFTPAQLQELRKASIARIYCDNSNVKEMQTLAFEGVSRRNPRVPCNGNNIPRVNLAVFKE